MSNPLQQKPIPDDTTSLQEYRAHVHRDWQQQRVGYNPEAYVQPKTTVPPQQQVLAKYHKQETATIQNVESGPVAGVPEIAWGRMPENVKNIYREQTRIAELEGNFFSKLQGYETILGAKATELKGLEAGFSPYEQYKETGIPSQLYPQYEKSWKQYSEKYESYGQTYKKYSEFYAIRYPPKKEQSYSSMLFGVPTEVKARMPKNVKDIYAEQQRIYEQHLEDMGKPPFELGVSIANVGKQIRTQSPILGELGIIPEYVGGFIMPFERDIKNFFGYPSSSTKFTSSLISSFIPKGYVLHEPRNVPLQAEKGLMTGPHEAREYVKQSKTSYLEAIIGPSSEMEEFLKLSPEVQQGILAGELFEFWLTGKAISKSLSYIAKYVPGWELGIPKEIQKLYTRPSKTVSSKYEILPSELPLSTETIPYGMDPFSSPNTMPYGLNPPLSMGDTQQSFTYLGKEGGGGYIPKSGGMMREFTELVRSKGSYFTPFSETFGSGQQLIFEQATKQALEPISRSIGVNALAEGIKVVSKATFIAKTAPYVASFGLNVSKLFMSELTPIPSYNKAYPGTQKYREEYEYVSYQEPTSSKELKNWQRSATIQGPLQISKQSLKQIQKQEYDLTKSIFGIGQKPMISQKPIFDVYSRTEPIPILSSITGIGQIQKQKQIQQQKQLLQQKSLFKFPFSQQSIQQRMNNQNKKKKKGKKGKGIFRGGWFGRTWPSAYDPEQLLSKKGSRPLGIIGGGDVKWLKSVRKGGFFFGEQSKRKKAKKRHS